MGYPDVLSAVVAPTTIAITSTLFCATYLFYRWLLPTPIPGIPYNPEAIKSVFGDIPSMLKHVQTSKMISDWIQSHTTRHASPIVQLFIDIFGKPVVVISDYRETQVELVSPIKHTIMLMLGRTSSCDGPRNSTSRISWAMYHGA